MKKLTDQAQDDKLRDIGGVLDKFNLSDQDRRKFTEFRQLVDKASKEIRRGIKQFDSTIAVVIVVGMLKAGKSTLINLFARNTNASPVGFGVDTTLRPALIKMREKSEAGGEQKGAIYVYTSRPVSLMQTAKSQTAPKSDKVSEENQHNDDKASEEKLLSDNEDEQFSEVLQGVMDELRGITPDTGRAACIKVTLELNQENLRHALCEKSSNVIPEEPVLVVIELPYNEDAELLKDGNYLLDMPGLDSANSEISKKLGTRYRKLVDQCDMVLCLQSSVAPLNQPALDCFQKVLETRSTATAWVIQNNVACKPWLKEEKINDEKNIQRQRAVEVISQLSDKLSVSAANLGQAYAALLERESFLRKGENLPDGTLIEPGKQGKLFEKSEFALFETNMIGRLRESGRITRFQHCKEELSRKVEEAIRNLKTYRDEQQGDCHQRKEHCDGWKGILGWIDEEIEKERRCADAQCVQLKERRIKEALKADLPSLALHMSEEEDVKEMPGSKIDSHLEEVVTICRRNAEKLLQNITIELSEVVENDEKKENTKEALKRERDEILGGVKKRIEQMDSKEELKGVMKEREKYELKEKIHIESALVVKERFAVPKGKIIHPVGASTKFENRVWGILWEKKHKNPGRIIEKEVEDIVQSYCNQIIDVFRAGKDDWLDAILKRSVGESLRLLKSTVEGKVAENEQEYRELQEHLASVDDLLKGLHTIQSHVNTL